MKQPIVQSPDGITLVGGAPVSGQTLQLALRLAPVAAAVDGGADRLLASGLQPQAVIGDFDSISAAALAAIPASRQFPIKEQLTTDFDKALRSVSAPVLLAVGFAGARMDHGLAALNALVRHAGQPCILIGPKDIAFAAPPRPLHLRLMPGDALSLFPLAAVSGRSEGLRWPIAGLDFAPDGFIGTSNEVSAQRVTLDFPQPGMVVLLPRRRLKAAIAALRG